MQILAIDTSTEFLSLALWLNGHVLSRDIHAGQTHSQQILPTLRELLDEANIDLKALDGVAFGAGPGFQQRAINREMLGRKQDLYLWLRQ